MLGFRLERGGMCRDGRQDVRKHSRDEARERQSRLKVWTLLWMGQTPLVYPRRLAITGELALVWVCLVAAPLAQEYRRVSSR